MAEEKYKTKTKDKLTKLADDLSKILGVRQPAPKKEKETGLKKS